MKIKRCLGILAAALFAVVLFGCAKEEIKTYPPFDKTIAEEDCAMLIIPSGVNVNRIDGKRRDIFRSWSSGTKAATLPVPAGERSILFEYSSPQDGLTAKKLDYTLEMHVGNMYTISVTLDEKAHSGILSSAFGVATSFIRDSIIGIIPFIDALPRANTEGLTFQIYAIDQEAFEQYLLEEDVKVPLRVRLLGVLIGILWYFIIAVLLRLLGYFLFMGKLKNSHPFTAFLISFALVVAGILLINYNSSGTLTMYLLATLPIGIGISGWDVGATSNKRGIAELKGEILRPSGNASENFESILESISTRKLQNNFEKAVYHFTKAIDSSPYNPEYINNRGLAYCHLQEWGKAINDFNRCHQLNPKNETYKQNIAYIQALAVKGRAGLS